MQHVSRHRLRHLKSAGHCPSRLVYLIGRNSRSLQCRFAAKAGVPIDRPALTVNRLCGSGIQSIVSGAQMIKLDEAKTVLAGGMESMSQAPHVIRGARWD